MLQQITWSDYWKMIITLTLLYECSILLLFYRKEILLLTKRKSLVLPVMRGAAAAVTNDSHDDDASSAPTTEEDNDYDEAEHLIPDASNLAEAIGMLISQATENNYAKEELLFGLRQLIKDCPRLKNTHHQRDINTMISLECKAKRTHHLSAGEIDKLWLS